MYTCACVCMMFACGVSARMSIVHTRWSTCDVRFPFVCIIVRCFRGCFIVFFKDFLCNTSFICFMGVRQMESIGQFPLGKFSQKNQ